MTTSRMGIIGRRFVSDFSFEVSIVLPTGIGTTPVPRCAVCSVVLRLTGLFQYCKTDSLRNHHLFGDLKLAYFFIGRQVVHEIEHQVFEDHAQTAGAHFALHGQIGDGFDGLFAEPEADVLEFKELLILLDDGVLRPGQNLDQSRAVQGLQHGAHRQTADEFRDETELDQIDRLGLAQQIDIAPPADVGGTADGFFLFGQEAHALIAGAARNYLFQTHESAAADKQNIGGIHRREFLVRVLAAALRGNVGNGAFQNLQKRLLYALARNVTGDGRVLVLTADLIDLVDVDNALLALLHVAIGSL